MSLDQAVTTYFDGEKLEALVFILPIGLASLLFGAWLVVDGKEPFARGAAWPFLLLGLLLAVVGGSVGFRTPSQLEALRSALASMPTEAVAAELARMAKVNAAWPGYLAMYAAFAVGGTVLRFALKAEFLRGIGAALLLFAGIGLLIDGFAERRATRYTEALEAAKTRAAG